MKTPSLPSCASQARERMSPWFSSAPPPTSMKILLALLLTIQLTSAPLAQFPPAARASAHVEQMQHLLQERTKSPIKNLDIDLIMLGTDFAGTAPSEVSWAGDSSKLWFRWKRPGEKESGIFEV